MKQQTIVRLAPMVGLTHFAVRRAIQDLLPEDAASFWPTEMLSSRRLPYEKANDKPEIIFEDRDFGLWPQLLGNEEFFIRESIKKLADWGARGIDINMGCPVKKALQHNYGVALMGDADYAARVTEFAVKSSALPVSVKLRAGIQRDENFLLNFARGLEQAGASSITLHPRTAGEGRRGEADWKQIKTLKSALTIPIAGNGDVQCVNDVLKMRAETHCDQVVVGRALLAKPWLIGFGTKNFSAPSEWEQGEIFGKFLLRVLDYSEPFYTEVETLKKLRFLSFHSTVWLEFGHFLFASLRAVKTVDEARATIHRFFSSPQRMFERSSRVR